MGGWTLKVHEVLPQATRPSPEGVIRWSWGIPKPNFPVEPMTHSRATFQPLSPFSRKKGLRREAEIPFVIAMVPKGGLEPPRVSPPPPQGAGFLQETRIVLFIK